MVQIYSDAERTQVGLAEFWNEACAVTSKMECAGAYFDVDRCKAAHALAAADQHALQSAWATHAGEVNPASPKQLTEFLYRTKKFPMPPVAGTLKAIKKRDPQKEPTSEASLDWLFRKARRPENQALLRCLLDLKKVTKFTQFLAKLPNYVDGHGWLRASFGPDTGTGRLASRNPNLQNIPSSDDKYGVRACFTAPPGYKLLVADYAALEPRILAHYLIALFDDHSLAEAILSGDLYGAVACRTWPDRLHGLTPKEVKEHPDPEVKKLRATAKVIVLGTNYGKGVPGLAVQLGIDEGQAQVLYDDYFTAYPNLKAFQAWAYQQAVEGRLRTLLGRTRIFSLGRTKGEIGRAQRQSTNTVIQGSAADLVMAAMVAQDVTGVGTLQLQIHDELVWRVPAGMDVSPLIEAMEHPLSSDLRMPLKAAYVLVDNWAEAKE